MGRGSFFKAPLGPWLLLAGGYVVPGDEAQPARVDAVLATSRAFGNFRFKDAAQTPGAEGGMGSIHKALEIRDFMGWENLWKHLWKNMETMVMISIVRW